MKERNEIRHFHLFCGLGGGAAGFNRGHARVGAMDAQFSCIGGVDSDPAAINDFGRLAGTPGTVLDMFDRDQYRAFHDAEPPADWREATPADIQAAEAGCNPNHIADRGVILRPWSRNWPSVIPALKRLRGELDLTDSEIEEFQEWDAA